MKKTVFPFEFDGGSNSASYFQDLRDVVGFVGQLRLQCRVSSVLSTRAT